MIPYSPYFNGVYESTGTILAREVVDAYFEIKQKNGETNEEVSKTIQTIKPVFVKEEIEEETEETIE